MSRKKRKPELDLDSDRTLYSSFVAAANSISHLYTQAGHQQKRAHTEGARSALERTVNWIVRENGNASSIPTSLLLDYLRYELQNVDSLEQQHAATFPVPFFQQPGTGVSPAKRLELNASAFPLVAGMHDEQSRVQHPQGSLHLAVPQMQQQDTQQHYDVFSGMDSDEGPHDGMQGRN